jgi:hypothetical protein
MARADWSCAKGERHGGLRFVRRRGNLWAAGRVRCVGRFVTSDVQCDFRNVYDFSIEKIIECWRRFKIL